VSGKTPSARGVTAYSYIRFSSKEQAKGDSFRRQTEVRDDWLARTGAVLDTSLAMSDLGVSAFTGTHRNNPDRHALAAFLELVKRGHIARGSFLLVENLDRLSREHIRPALTLLLNLIEAGIRIVQLSPVETVYDENVEPMALMMAIMELSRGHAESRRKSEIIGKAWRGKKARARDGGEIVTKQVPSWLRVENGRFVFEVAHSPPLQPDRLGQQSLTFVQCDRLSNVGDGRVCGKRNRGG
jgi:DNA invertase Pin-like site-specific DNA recombinase